MLLLPCFAFFPEHQECHHGTSQDCSDGVNLRSRAPRQPFSVSTRFPRWGFLLRARQLKTLVARSREQFFMTYRTSGEAVLWERVVGFRVLHKTAGSSCNGFATKNFSTMFFLRGFQLSRERRQKHDFFYAK